MHALAEGDNIYDLHGAQVRFGGDVFLQPRSERFAELIADESEQQSKWNQHETPQRRLRPPQREPGEGPGKKRGGGEVGSTARVDR